MIQQGGRGALTSLFPRGGESDYTLVIVDGIPLNAFGGSFDARAPVGAAGSSASKWSVDRRARCTAAARSAASCDVMTPHGGAIGANAIVEVGGYGTAQTSAVTSGARGAWSWGATFDWLDTDGDTAIVPSLGQAVANDDYKRLPATRA